MDTSAHIAAGNPFEYRGKTYIVSPPEIKDFVELKNYLRRYVLQSAEASLEGITLAELREQVIQDAIADAKRIEINSLRFNQLAQETDGVIYLAWLCLRKKQPELSHGDVQTMMVEKAMELHTAVNDAAGYKEAIRPNVVAPQMMAGAMA